jgi:hypothetical protein
MKETFPGPTKVYDADSESLIFSYEDFARRGFSKRDMQKLPFPELMECVARWVCMATS